MNPKNYSDEEAREILKRAVDFQEQEHFQYSRQQLLELGREMGLSEDAIVKAEREMLTKRVEETPVQPKPTTLEIPIEEEERLFRRHRMAEFRQHFTLYGIIITFLLLLNLVTTGFDPIWAIYPALGWGIGVAVHFFTSRQFEGDEYEKAFEEWLAKRISRSRRRQQLTDGDSEPR